MDITDLTKNIRQLLLNHWSEKEINERLVNPEYFFDHVVNPHLDYLRRSGKDVPRIRLKRNPDGELLILAS